MPVTRRTLLQTAAIPLAGGWTALAQRGRLARKDCFFGLHLDLHPNKTDTALGRDVTEEMVENLLARVKPDFLQYDCKGHVGYLGYPSKVSTPAPGIVKDSLEVYRRVTAKHGVALFIHFSGLWDSLAIQQHPEWAVVRPDGTPDPNATTPFGPYVDERMIPQLKEASEKYDLDGAWVDGECWAARLDYSRTAANAFADATGIRPLPRGPNDRGWLEFLEFNRERFRKYVTHYIDELHRSRPKFQIASNWLYTTYVPERPEIPVDFLSGDYLGNAAVSSARLDARYLSAVGKPWDLMAWGFQRGSGPRGGFSHKSTVQLQQEAAVVLAQGGGFQVYYTPTRAGRIDEKHVAVMAKLARFCRDRQAVSHQSEPVPQVGVVFSKHSLYSTANKLFGGWGAAVDPARGVIDALVDNHYSVDVIPDWKLEESAARYPLIVLPNWPNAGLQVKGVLTRYVGNGGRLLIVGAENANLFASELPVRFTKAAADQPAFVSGDEVFGNVRGLWQDIEPGQAENIERRYPTFDSTRDASCAATLSTLGKGSIAAVYGPIGTVYASMHAPATRQFLRRVVERVFAPMIEVEAPPTIEIAVRRKGGKLLIHMINTTAMQVAGEYAVVDFIPAVGPFTVAVRAQGKPVRVTLEPGGQPINGAWKDGRWTGKVERLEIHGVLAFEMA